MDVLQNNKRRAPLQLSVRLAKASRLLLLLYIFVMPFVSAFSFTGTISFPLIFGFLLFVIMLLQLLLEGGPPPGFIGYDILIVSVLLLVCISSYFFNGWGNSKSLNHTVAYIASFLFFYIAVKFSFFCIEEKLLLFRQVLFIITCIVIISAVYASIEFALANFADININDYVPRPSAEEKNYNALAISLFIRARGFASESGAYTQMMELFTPLSLYYMFFSGYCKWKLWLKVILTIIIALSVIFAVSSATFIVVPVAILFSILIYYKKIFIYLSNKTFSFYLKTITVIALIIVISEYLSIYANIILSITDKADSSSFDDRAERMNLFYSLFEQSDLVGKLIGRGPAASDILGLDSNSSILSLYYGTTFQLGLLGLLLILLLIIYFFIHIVSAQSKLGFFLLIAFLSGALHYYVMSNYWVPWFWFLGAFAVYYNSLIKNSNKDYLAFLGRNQHN